MNSNLQENIGQNGQKKSPRLAAGIKNYLVDIDGVICEDIPNEEPERMKTAQEIPGARETINQLYNQGNIITFFTARTEDLAEITADWLNQRGFKYHRIIFNKPRGGNYVYIDDKEIEYKNSL
ncbi:MAG: phosphoheptose isomerase [Patescibacteria group bacterium]